MSVKKYFSVNPDKIKRGEANVGYRRFAFEYILVFPIALLMLTLFDSNAWWKVLLFSLAAAALNTVAVNRLAGAPPPGAVAFGRGAMDAILAFLCGLTPFFRTTFGTLVGFVLLLGLLGLTLDRLMTKVRGGS